MENRKVEQLAKSYCDSVENFGENNSGHPLYTAAFDGYVAGYNEARSALLEELAQEDAERYLKDKSFGLLFSDEGNGHDNDLLTVSDAKHALAIQEAKHWKEMEEMVSVDKAVENFKTACPYYYEGICAGPEMNGAILSGPEYCHHCSCVEVFKKLLKQKGE